MFDGIVVGFPVQGNEDVEKDNVAVGFWELVARFRTSTGLSSPINPPECNKESVVKRTPKRVEFRGDIKVQVSNKSFQQVCQNAQKSSTFKCLVVRVKAAKRLRKADTDGQEQDDKEARVTKGTAEGEEGDVDVFDAVREEGRC